jgi:plasmid stabilization system protein ParE
MASSEQEASGDAPRRYQIEYSDSAQEEIEKAYLWLSGLIGVEKANRWAEGLKSAVEARREHPYRNVAVASRPGARRLLDGKFHILYRVVEPDEGEVEGIVRILNVYHGTSRRAG